MPPQMPPKRCSECPLRSLAAFSTSSEETVRKIEAARASIRHYRPRDVIFRAGDPVQEAHSLFDGYAITYRLLEGGERQVVRFLLPGDLLYEVRDSGAIWRESAEAVEYAVTCVLSRKALNDLFEHDIHIAHSIALINDREERLLEEHITDLGRRPAVERVGRLLLELFHRQRQRGRTEGARCYLPFTQEQIGDALGLSSVYVSRVLARLKDMDVLSFKRPWLVIPDFDAAARRFDYSPAYLHPRPLI